MRLLLSAGETSGDRLGAALLRELKRLRPDLSAFGMGGPRMEAEGLDVCVRSEDVAVVGLVEVIRKLPRVFSALRRLRRAARAERPAAAILVDFPDFHFRLGRQLAREGIPVVYYVSPQVWAWRAGRLKVMKTFVRRMITLFPFELPLYRNAGIDAVCAGHPLADEVDRHRASAEGLPPPDAALRVVLMPGSREGEVRRHWPLMREASVRMRRGRDVEFFVVPAPRLSPDLFPGAAEAGIAFFHGNVDALLASADLLVVSSGTATLQGALAGVPMIVVYRTSAATFAIARRLVRVPHVALANIVAGERVAPELLQADATPDAIAREAGALLDSPERRADVRRKWAAVREALGPRDAAARAAEAVLEVLPA
jgi:lipid-A-disaccharide synthase